MDLVTKHKIICKELNGIYAKKNHDYGNSFGNTFEKLGIISAVTRITDKYNRLVSLSTLPEEDRKVKDETISDTLLDLANYCIMTELALREQKNKKDKDKLNEKKVVKKRNTLKTFNKAENKSETCMKEAVSN